MPPAYFQAAREACRSAAQRDALSAALRAPLDVPLDLKGRGRASWGACVLGRTDAAAGCGDTDRSGAEVVVGRGHVRLPESTLSGERARMRRDRDCCGSDSLLI